VIFNKHLIHTQKHKKKHWRKKLTPVEQLMFVVSFMYPFTAIPQVYKVYSTQDVSSLSLLSWSLYVVFASIFLAYSFRKKLLPLIIEGGLWLIVDMLMVLAILLYG
jgi:uncharacterized protein with PQ loop repeat